MISDYPRESGDPESYFDWIPAFAGMIGVGNLLKNNETI